MRPIEVVIVEDDPMVVEVNKSFVNAVSGFKVVGVAKEGLEALQIIERLRPKLTLLDIFLPDIDGVAALQEIRKRGLPTDVIMVTAAQDSEIIQNVFRYGAVDYIIKPFKFVRLKNALESFASLYNKLNTHTFLDQEEIDRLALGRGATVDNDTGVPKGLNELTLKQVALCLIKKNAALSAEEVAEELGLARVTARRYLEYLDRVGRVKLELQYGSVGRPIKRYKIK